MRPVLGDLDAARRRADALAAAVTVQGGYLLELNRELRRGLNAVAGGADGLLDDAQAFGLTPDQSQRIGALADVAAGLTALLDRVGAVTELSGEGFSVRPDRVDPSWVARDVARALKAQADEGGVTLHAPPPRARLLATADPVRLRQLLINLAGYAVHDSLPDCEVRIDLREEGDEVVVAIAAPGVVLSERRIAALFTPAPEALTDFHIIGVSIARRLAEAMGGTLRAGREAGGGLEIELTLPLAERRSGQDDDPATDETTLLLISGQEAAGAAMRRGLQRQGGRLFTAAPADNPAVLARDLRPDAVLIDVDDPGLDPFRLKAQLDACGLCASLPVVGLTARHAPADERRALQAGFAAWTPWPTQAGALGWLLSTARDRTPRREAA